MAPCSCSNCCRPTAAASLRVRASSHERVPRPDFVVVGCRRIAPVGVPGGALERVLFLKRCRAPKDLGTLRSAAPHFEHNGWLGRDGALPEGATAFVELEDLDVGRTVQLVGQEMRVVGCEPSSRIFLAESLGVELAADEHLF